MPRLIPKRSDLPKALYRAGQVREFDRIAIEEFGIPGSVLMNRAGSAAFALLRTIWPAAKRVLVLCGAGNNGGDGFVVARLAREAGLTVGVVQLGDQAKLRGDALGAASAWHDAGGATEEFGGSLPRDVDVIVDALLGTGLERAVRGDWRRAIELTNRHSAGVLAVDIPSGLHADTGRPLGAAVEADHTITFIALKQGLFTGAARQFTGEIHFDALAIPARIYGREILAARRVEWRHFEGLLGRRRRDAHKGDFGHVLVAGGAPGMSGAPRIAAEAAARGGAGLVSVATHPAHAVCINSSRPELMCRGVAEPADLVPLLRRCSVVALGPGLGRTEWAQALYGQLLEARLPLVLDADGLNLLAGRPERRENWVLTPHPGEAARLLETTIEAVEADRFGAVMEIGRRYGGVCVLKGAGTLVHGNRGKPPAVCSDGNPGMASGGMGDALTGLIAALIAQGQELQDAAEMGVCLHAAAADRAAALGGEVGLLACDLMPEVRALLNPGAGA